MATAPPRRRAFTGAEGGEVVELGLGAQRDQHRARGYDEAVRRVWLELLAGATSDGESQRTRATLQVELAERPTHEAGTAVGVDLLDTEVEILVVHHDV